jgi:hypothetical protein
MSHKLNNFVYHANASFFRTSTMFVYGFRFSGSRDILCFTHCEALVIPFQKL